MIFSDEQKPKDFITIRPGLQEIFLKVLQGEGNLVEVRNMDLQSGKEHRCKNK